MILYENIPKELIDLDQWVCWRLVERNGRSTKVPDGKTNDPSTWLDFDAAVERYESGGYSGIGFVFSAGDPYVGLDMDDLASLDEANELINDCPPGVYAEISPSGRGVKIWLRGKLPGGGKNVSNREAYDQGRFFTVTGQLHPACGSRHAGQEIPEAQYVIDHVTRVWFGQPAGDTDQPKETPTGVRLSELFELVDKLKPAVSGKGGHNTTFHAFCEIWRRGPMDSDAVKAAERYNDRCDPPWTAKEMIHKLKDARKYVVKSGEFGLYADLPTFDHLLDEPAGDSRPAEVSLVTTFATVAPGVLDRLRRRESLPCFNTGLGLRLMRGEITGIVSGPGIGKTTMAVWMLTNALHHDPDVRALFYEVEMSTESLLERQLSMVADVPADRFQFGTGDLTDAEMQRIEAWEAQLRPINSRLACVNDVTVGGLLEAVKAWRPGIVVLDYVQRVRDNAASDEKESVAVAMDLARRLCRHDMAVLVISSSNRMSGYQQMEMTSFRGSSEVEYGVGFAYGLQLESADNQNTFVCRCLKSRYGAPISPFAIHRLESLRLQRDGDFHKEGFAEDGCGTFMADPEA